MGSRKQSRWPDIPESWFEGRIPILDPDFDAVTDLPRSSGYPFVTDLRGEEVYDALIDPHPGLPAHEIDRRYELRSR